MTELMQNEDVRPTAQSYSYGSSVFIYLFIYLL